MRISTLLIPLALFACTQPLPPLTEKESDALQCRQLAIEACGSMVGGCRYRIERKCLAIVGWRNDGKEWHKESLPCPREELYR